MLAAAKAIQQIEWSLVVTHPSATHPMVDRDDQSSPASFACFDLFSTQQLSRRKGNSRESSKAFGSQWIGVVGVRG